MAGHILDGHVPGQGQGIAGKSSGVTAPAGGEVDLHLAQDATEPAEGSLHQQFDPDGLAAYRKRAKSCEIGSLPGHAA